jgi:TolB-like protein/Tfp pilus assembly protein PilF
MREAETTALDLGMAVLSVDCAEQKRGVAYAPWVELIRQYVDSTPRDRVYRTVQPYLAGLAQLVPELKDRVWLYDPATTPVESGSRSLVEAVTRFLVALSDVRPLLISMDNLGRTDARSLELLDALVGVCRKSSLGIVGAYRDTHVKESKSFRHFLQSQGGKECYRNVVLLPLNREHLGELIAAVLGQSDVPRNVRDAIYAKTRGNPSYTVELLQWLADQQKVFLTPGGLAWASISEITQPVAVEHAIEARLGWLPETVPPTKPVPTRIAVLPLANMSPDPNDAYFADGLTDEIISTVSRIRELSVISRTSVMQYKNRAKHMAEICRELNAGTVLEGSVRKVGNRARIAVQLIDAVGDQHLWAENYDRELEDIFAIQSEIANKVATALQIRLLSEDQERIGKAPTEVTEAHLLYMKGVFHQQHFTREELLSALGYFEQAVQEDPRYALAHAAIAWTYSFLGFHEMIPFREASAKAEAAARKALELDPTLAEAHNAMSWVLFISWNFPGAAKEIEDALALNPNLSSAHAFAGELYVETWQTEKGFREAQTALDLDPLSVSTMREAAAIYLYGGRPERAAELFQKALELDPTDYFALGNLGLCHVRQGRYEQGIAEIRRSIQLQGSPSLPSQADLAYALAMGGRTDEARNVLAGMIKYHETHQTGASMVAVGYACIGEKEAAFEWLERAYVEHSARLAGLSIDFAFEALREDPRFQRFLGRMGNPPKTTHS